jgi:magnesium transporter
MVRETDALDRVSLHTRGDGKQITCVVFHHGEPAPPPRDLGDISEILDEPGNVVWFDVVDPGPNDLALLQEEFALHPLAVEDAVVAHQRPKIESYETYWFLVVQAVSVQARGVVLHEIAIFAGKNFLVTVRHDPAYPLDEIEQRWSLHPEELRKGAGFLLYTILDTVVDGFIPVAETFHERVDLMEEMLFDDDSRNDSVLPRIFRMKKDAQQFRHAALPMREILTPLTRQDLSLYSHDEALYFRDVYDHAVLVIDQLDSLRDLVNSALEIHLSVVANRQNEVAKQLTIIATIFLPLSFVVGFFGQNFGWMVEHLGGESTFGLLGIGTELLAVGLTLWFFKSRGWF